MQLNTMGMVHDFLSRVVEEENLCIDATAGKGRDTELLCKLVGSRGRVLSFDIQADAIMQTEQLLEKEKLKNATVILDNHSNMEQYAEVGSVDCIVFNFGRLPGGDPHIFTTADNSIAAVSAGLRLLKSGGVMCLSIYYGGDNGYGERDALLDYLENLDDREVSVLTSFWNNRPNNPPISAFLWKH